MRWTISVLLLVIIKKDIMNAIDRAQAEVHLLIERSPEALTV